MEWGGSGSREKKKTFIPLNLALTCRVKLCGVWNPAHQNWYVVSVVISSWQALQCLITKILPSFFLKTAAVDCNLLFAPGLIFQTPYLLPHLPLPSSLAGLSRLYISDFISPSQPVYGTNILAIIGPTLQFPYYFSNEAMQCLNYCDRWCT